MSDLSDKVKSLGEDIAMYEQWHESFEISVSKWLQETDEYQISDKTEREWLVKRLDALYDVVNNSMDLAAMEKHLAGAS